MLGRAATMLDESRRPREKTGADRSTSESKGRGGGEETEKAGSGGRAATNVSAEVKAKADKLLSEAESLLVAGYEGLRKTESTIPAPGKQNIERTRRALVKLYRRLGKPKEAAQYEAAGKAASDH